jgi:hypothetical protein
MYRQGDLLFIKTSSLGGDCKITKSKVVLASSITGHDHEIKDGVVYTHEPSWGDRANFYVEVPDGGTELIHPEHKSIPLSEGIYKVIRQREVNGYVRD